MQPGKSRGCSATRRVEERAIFPTRKASAIDDEQVLALFLVGHESRFNSAPRQPIQRVPRKIRENFNTLLGVLPLPWA